MPRLTDIAHEHLRTVITAGDTVIDATIGNGYDTLFLAECVTEAGRVFGFDVQAAAVEKTRARLQQAQITNTQLYLQSHAEMLAVLPSTCIGQVSAVMFNLGYLPGSSREIVTQTQSSNIAIEQALTLLKPGGLLSVLAYPGHAGGDVETSTLIEKFACWQQQFGNVETHRQSELASSPVLFLIRKPIEP
jgi:predicted methyltransferase